jgi:ADP-heptose:LPS heptosyltransferase
MTPSRLLILKPSSLGDIVHTLPAVAALRARFPAARITWMVNPEWSTLLDGNPDINDLLLFPRSEFRGPAGWLRFRRWCADLSRQTPPDLILDFQGLLRTGLVARTFRGVPVCGLSDAREGSRFFHTRTIDVTPSSHAVERYLALAGSLGADTSSAPVFRLPEGRPPEAALPATPFVVLHPFSRGARKSLDSSAVLAFCRSLALPVVLVGRGSVDFPSTPANIVNLLDRTTLPELVWLLRHAAFVVSVDSGPMHLAAALTGQLLGIHTWSDPCRVGPYRPGAHVWKGGVIFPALDPASSQAGNKLPDPAAAETIARWVRTRLESPRA